MRPIFIVCNMDDEPVMAFTSRRDAEMVACSSDGVSSVIQSTVLIEGSENEDMPVER